MKGHSIEHIKYQVYHFFTSRCMKGQGLLTVQLVRYLLLKDKTGKNTRTLRNQLTALDSGHCYGLAILNQTMKLLGKNAQRKWKEALRQIAIWDGTEQALSKSIDFPGFKDHISLDKTMELAINYIVFHQGNKSDLGDFKLINFEQRKLLSAQGNYFEISFPKKSADKKVQSIKKYASIAECFTKKELTQLLDEDQAEKFLYLLSSRNHAISISYSSKKKVWSVYDSNYDHTNVNKMEKLFETKDKLIDEIIKRMTFGIRNKKFNASYLPIEIQIATWKPHATLSLASFEQLLADPPRRFYETDGLHFLALHRPDLLPSLLDKIMLKSSQDKKICARSLFKKKHGWSSLHKVAYTDGSIYLSLFWHPFFKSNKRKKILVKSLTSSSTNKWTPLHLIAEEHPKIFLSFITHPFFKRKKIKNLLMKIFKKKTQAGWTVLHILAKSDPTVILPLLESNYFKSEKMKKTIIHLLNIKTKHQLTPLHLLIENNPKEFLSVLLYLKKTGIFLSPENEKIFINILTKPNKGKWTLLHSITHTKERLLIKLFENDVFDTHKLRKTLAKAFQMANEYGWTPIHLIARNEPKMLLEMIKNNFFCTDELKKSLLTIFLMVNKYGCTPIHLIADHDPKVLLEMIKSEFTFTGDFKKSFLSTLSMANRYDWTPIHYIARKKTEFILEMFESYFFHADDAKKTLLSALEIPDKEGWTSIHSIARYKPIILLKILEGGFFYTPILKKSLLTTLGKANNDGWTPIHLIAAKYPELLLILIEKNFFEVTDIRECLLHAFSVANKDQKTPLFYISVHASNIFVALYKHHFVSSTDLNKKDKDGKTLAHHAAASGHENMLKTLVKLKADFSIKDNNGLLPVDCAKEEKIKEMIRALEKENKNVLHSTSSLFFSAPKTKIETKKENKVGKWVFST